MNNKSFYAIGAFSAIVAMLPRLPEWVNIVLLTLICGISLYYVFNQWQKLRKVKLMMLLMFIIAILLNPFYTFPFENQGIMIVVKLFAGILFWLAAKGEAIETHAYNPFDGKNMKKEEDQSDNQRSVGPRE